MGTQVITVSLTDRDSDSAARKASSAASQRKPLDSEALVAAVASMPEVETASELVSLSCRESARAHHPLTATRPELERILGLALASGRFVHPLDRHDLWVVLGARFAQQLQERGHRMEPGSVLTLCSRSMRLAGVLTPMSSSEAIVPMELDDGALVSSNAGRRIDPQGTPNQLALRIKPGVSPIAFAPQLSARLTELTGRDIQVTTAKKILELRQRQAASTARFLASLSGLSLLVGSLGILNVMLMAVMERRREIGMRMAVGADDVDIVLQFLCESVFLASAGGACGVVLGLIGASVAALVADLPLVFAASGPALASSVSLLVGIASGLYPAIQAARLTPAEALQSQ